MNSVPLVPLLAVALLAGCTRHAEPAAAAPALPPARVQLDRVALEEVPALTEVTGTVRPVQRATLAAKVMGTISGLPVALGQRVRAGEPLLKISAAEITARVTQAQSQLNLAGRDLARERDLLAKGASTAEMVRNLEDRFTLTEAMVREAETMLGYTELRAPFDGVVARKLVHAGDLAAPGQPLLEIEGAGDFEVEAGIPDSLAARLAPGVELSVDVPATGAAFTARLVELASAADADARTVTAKLAVPAGATVRSGLFARVQVPGAPVRTLLVPAGAVSLSGQMERVFIAGEGNRAVLRLVKTGAPRNGRIEILAGLAAGDTVVINPPAGLREGQPLEVRP